MARYIDADLLKDEILSNAVRLNHPEDLCRETTIFLIGVAPTADVVEVVRCKKCTHKVDFKGRVMCNRYAKKVGDEWYGLTATDNDHFCSYGECRVVTDTNVGSKTNILK